MNATHRTFLLFLLITWLPVAVAAPMQVAMTTKEVQTFAFERGDLRSSVAGLRQHAENGNPDAQYILGWVFSGQPMKMGDKPGTIMGNWMRYGEISPPENRKEAARWFRMAAEQGHVEAQMVLAEMYDRGYGVPEDKEEALRWYRLAAEQGDVDAQYALAERYRWGRGVPEDRLEASRYYQLAADQGSLRAKQELMALHGLCPSQKHGSVSQEKRELIARFNIRTCDLAMGNQRFWNIQELLRKAGEHYLGEEITVEEAYPYIRCSSTLARTKVHLLPLIVENLFDTKAMSLNLINYLVDETCDRELLGKIAGCRADIIGRGCLDIFEHVEVNKKVHNSPLSQEQFGILLRKLNTSLRQVGGMRRDAAFCRDFLGEPPQCQD